MRYFLSLQSIKGKDNLATLFNHYLKGLHTQAIVAEPTYYTMAEVRQHAARPRTRQGQCYHSCAARYYELTILINSLTSIHSHVLAAISLLEGFERDYGTNLLAYAQENRRHCIQEYGSDDEADWYRHDELDETEEWKITETIDPARLTHYTLWTELGRFIGGEVTETRGEYIGMSSPDDFATYSTILANQSVFSLRKVLSAVSGKEVTFTRFAQDGTQTPMTLGDHVEEELNQDLAGERLVSHFNLVLGFCQTIRNHYQTLVPNDLIGYRTLLACLRRVRDVDFPEGLLNEMLQGF